MPICPKCKKEVDDAVFCEDCGTLIREACPGCGTWIDVSMKECRKCGRANRIYQE